VEPFTGFHYKGSPIALPANIRQGWKRQTLANTKAHDNAKLITAIKSFILHANGLDVRFEKLISAAGDWAK